MIGDGMRARTLTLLFLPILLHAATVERWNVVLISIDTLRADHLGSYGFHSTVSPGIDALARESVQYDNVFTPVPLTLPAHTSLLTSLYPNRHGIHDNGETLPASVPTLAETFAAGGYETAAFIGSFILDRRFGLSRGFDEYTGNFDLHKHAGDDPGTVQFRGDRIESGAEQWLKKPHTRPFFLFLHFYDLHGPFLLPSPWRERYRQDPYDGELAYVDSLISRFRASLQAAGLARKTILVITADHGEGLGEHGENNHGFFVYHSTTRIPLIIHFPDARGAGKRIQPVVRLIDIGPTLLAAVGLPSLRDADGVSLLGAITGDQKLDLGAYSETVYPFRHFHCTPLMAWTTQGHTLIQAPRQELYANGTDPGQTRNIVSQDPQIASELMQHVRPFAEALRNASIPPASPEMLAKLRSLGYLGGASPSLANLADPKDRIKLFGEYQDALSAGAAGRSDKAIAGLERVLAVDPSIVGGRIELGLTYQRIERDQDAVKEFRSALHTDPRNALVHYDLGISLGNLHDDGAAVSEFDLAVSLSPSFSRAFVGRGLAQARMGQLREAIASLTAALAIDANDFDALYNRGSLFGALGQFDGCRRDLAAAAAVEPDNAAVHVALATLDMHLGDDNRAHAEFQKAVSLAPRLSSAHSGLGFLYLKLKDPAKASAELKKALDLDPNNSDARDALRSIQPRN
jgi:choline-sulfatase